MPPPCPGDEGAAPRAAPPRGARGLRRRRRPIQELDGGTARRATVRGTATASTTAVAPSKRWTRGTVCLRLEGHGRGLRCLRRPVQTVEEMDAQYCAPRRLEGHGRGLRCLHRPVMEDDGITRPAALRGAATASATAVAPSRR